MNLFIFICALALVTLPRMQSYAQASTLGGRTINFKPKISISYSKSYGSSKIVLAGPTGGLDAETLGVLGDTSDISGDLVDGAFEAATPVASVLTKIVASPAILAVPIGAGFLVAFGIGFFIYWYSRGPE